MRIPDLEEMVSAAEQDSYLRGTPTGRLLDLLRADKRWGMTSLMFGRLVALASAHDGDKSSLLHRTVFDEMLGQHQDAVVGRVGSKYTWNRQWLIAATEAAMRFEIEDS